MSSLPDKTAEVLTGLKAYAEQELPGIGFIISLFDTAGHTVYEMRAPEPHVPYDQEPFVKALRELLAQLGSRRIDVALARLDDVALRVADGFAKMGDNWDEAEAQILAMELVDAAKAWRK